MTTTSFPTIHQRISMHHRKSIRLQGYDYSQAGYYYITICSHNHQELFGSIENGETVLSEIGSLVKTFWEDIPSHFPVTLDQWVIMPNHIHGIIVIHPSNKIVDTDNNGCNQNNIIDNSNENTDNSTEKIDNSTGGVQINLNPYSNGNGKIVIQQI